MKAHLFGRVTALAALAVFTVSCAKEEVVAPPPPVVKTMTVAAYDVPIQTDFIGQTRGSTEVEIRARVEGFLDGIHFLEGTTVKKGQLLYTIDPRQWDAEVGLASGELGRAEAERARAQQDVNRYKPLVDENAISREEYETSVAIERSQRASVEAKRASLDRARLNRAFCTITAPIDGLVGKTEVKAGNLVGRGESTLLTTISTVDPIHVRFSLTENQYLAMRRRSLQQGYDSAKVPLELILSDGTVHPYVGHLVLADRNVDPATGTLLLEARFANPQRVLRPGQFGRVRATVEIMKNAIVVPQRAVAEMQGTYRVAVVTAKNTVEIRPVTVGPRVGSLWVIMNGLKPGERIVTDGVQKIANKVPVRPTDARVNVDSVLNSLTLRN
jgi:membrane fusion protein (multidrug efflux system)